MPPITARARGAAVADPELRRLLEALYVTFRGRRSLLLLDLERQVSLEELPWVAALAPCVGEGEASRATAGATLKRVARLALVSFPHTIVPNRLVKELRALASAAGKPLPFVEELAADIFMGEFSGTAGGAASCAACNGTWRGIVDAIRTSTG
ncbi:MAG: hypothetical protein U0166_16230 [Acidobacteriota bacterium]